MRIAFVGSREFPDKEFVQMEVIARLNLIDNILEPPAYEFVSGGARGVDTWAEEQARKLGLICWIFPADWIKHGKSAGYIRNEDIVNHADHIVAFWDGESKGTKHTIDLAIKAKKPVDIYIRRKNES